MEESSIKKNFAYKSALTISTYLMNFVTFPYVARVLGVEGIGLVSFVDNTVNYFLLFATMGVNILGVREIAFSRNNKVECDLVFSNILGMNVMFTLSTLIVYYVCVYFISSLHQCEELFYIGGAKILFTAFLVEWFFTGVENFRYITLRSLFIKLLHVITVFIFIRNKDDYKLYFLLTVAVVVINAVVNIFYVRKYVRLLVKELLNRKYVKQNFSLGIYSLMTSMYLTFNVMFLGLSAGNVEVGYYTTAFKLYSVVLGFFTAFTNVMLPRMSTLLAEGEKQKFQQMIEKSFEVVCTFSIPLILCSMVLAPQFIYILSGTGYEGAVLPMRIIMPAILFVGIAQVLAVQILMPLRKDKVLFIASLLGAIFSLIINITLIPYLRSVGTAIVLLCSEFLVTIVYLRYILKNRMLEMPWNILWQNFLYSLPCILICYICKQYITDNFLAIGVAIIGSAFCWCGIQIYCKTTIGKYIYSIID